MSKLIVLFAILLMAVSQKSYGVISLEIDGTPCESLGNQTFSYESNTKFRVLDIRTDGSTAHVDFEYTNGANTSVETLDLLAHIQKPQVVQELVLKEMPYRPEQKISEYIKSLNSREIKAIRTISWNADRSKTFNGGDYWSPTLVEMGPKNINFFAWRVVVDQENNKSDIMVQYCFKDDMLINSKGNCSELRIFSYEHEVFNRSDVAGYYCDSLLGLREESLVSWTTVPQIKNDWAKSNEVISHVYDSAVYSLPVGLVLEEDDGCFLKEKTFEKKIEDRLYGRSIYTSLVSNFMFCEDERTFFTTELFTYNVEECYSKGGDYQDVSLKKFKFLRKSPVSLNLDSQTTLSCAFEKGFYQLSQNSAEQGFWMQTWEALGPLKKQVMCFTPGGILPFSTIDLTQILMDSSTVLDPSSAPDPRVERAIKYLNYGGSTEYTPKIIISKKEGRVSKEIMFDRLYCTLIGLFDFCGLANQIVGEEYSLNLFQKCLEKARVPRVISDNFRVSGLFRPYHLAYLASCEIPLERIFLEGVIDLQAPSVIPLGASLKILQKMNLKMQRLYLGGLHLNDCQEDLIQLVKRLKDGEDQILDLRDALYSQKFFMKLSCFKFKISY